MVGEGGYQHYCSLRFAAQEQACCHCCFAGEQDCCWEVEEGLGLKALGSQSLEEER